MACGELRQLLTMQKAVAADRFAVAASPPQQTLREAPPVTPDASLLAAASNPEKRHKAIQTEKGPGGREQLADRDKQITCLRAALAASERQRERQAAAHKQELEALRASLGQVGSATFPFILARDFSGVSFLRASAPTRCFALTIRVVCLLRMFHCTGHSQLIPQSVAVKLLGIEEVRNLISVCQAIQQN